jgi:hypothetical protein
VSHINGSNTARKSQESIFSHDAFQIIPFGPRDELPHFAISEFVAKPPEEVLVGGRAAASNPLKVMKKSSCSQNLQRSKEKKVDRTSPTIKSV